MRDKARHIDSPKNPTVKALVRLKERRVREREGRYLIEGAREVTRAVQANIFLEQIYFAPEFLQEEGQGLLELPDVTSVETSSLSKTAFERISLRRKPDGILGVAKMQEQNLEGLKLAQNALVLVIDGLEKPGNVGALLRTADAANLAAVFLTGAGTDLYNPNVIRASMGSVFSRPVLNVDTQELISYLTDRNFKLVAATPAATQGYWQETLTGPTALVLGTEHEGLGKDWLKAASSQVVIPMSGLADSLNVSVSGALLMYEALRQRQVEN